MVYSYTSRHNDKVTNAYVAHPVADVPVSPKRSTFCKLSLVDYTTARCSDLFHLTHCYHISTCAYVRFVCALCNFLCRAAAAKY
jgi:hypothetical protein